MACHILIVDEPALSDIIFELFFSLFISDSDEWNAGYGQCDSAFLMEYFILVSDGYYNFIEIASSVVCLRWSHFEHPAAILEEQRKFKVAVLL